MRRLRSGVWISTTVWGVVVKENRTEDIYKAHTSLNFSYHKTLAFGPDLKVPQLSIAAIFYD